MPLPASPSLQREHARCSGAARHIAPRPAPPFQGTRHQLPQFSKERAPGWGRGPCARGFLGAGAGLGLHLSPSAERSGRYMVVPGPHLAFGTLTLPSLKPSCRTLLQISRHPCSPSPHPQHTSGNWRGTAAMCQELWRALCTSLTRARLEQQLVTARVWAGTCARARVPETGAVTSPGRTWLCKFRLKCCWLMCLHPWGFSSASKVLKLEASRNLFVYRRQEFGAVVGPWFPL